MEDMGHGQVWWADLDKIRPVVVLTRSRVAPRLPRVLVAPITTTVRGLTTEVAVGAREGVREGSVANLDNVQLVPVDGSCAAPAASTAIVGPSFCAAMEKVMAC